MENPIRMDDMGGYSYFRKPPSTNCLWSPFNFPCRAPQKTHHRGTLLFSRDPRPRRSLSEAAIKEMLTEVRIKIAMKHSMTTTDNDE